MFVVQSKKAEAEQQFVGILQTLVIPDYTLQDSVQFFVKQPYKMHFLIVAQHQLRILDGCFNMHLGYWIKCPAQIVSFDVFVKDINCELYFDTLQVLNNVCFDLANPTIIKTYNNKIISIISIDSRYIYETLCRELKDFI